MSAGYDETWAEDEFDYGFVPFLNQSNHTL